MYMNTLHSFNQDHMTVLFIALTPCCSDWTTRRRGRGWGATRERGRGRGTTRRWRGRGWGTRGAGGWRGRGWSTTRRRGRRGRGTRGAGGRGRNSSSELWSRRCLEKVFFIFSSEVSEVQVVHLESPDGGRVVGERSEGGKEGGRRGGREVVEVGGSVGEGRAKD